MTRSATAANGSTLPDSDSIEVPLPVTGAFGVAVATAVVADAVADAEAVAEAVAVAVAVAVGSGVERPSTVIGVNVSNSGWIAPLPAYV
jgi:hypothetical protein